MESTMENKPLTYHELLGKRIVYLANKKMRTPARAKVKAATIRTVNDAQISAFCKPEGMVHLTAICSQANENDNAAFKFERSSPNVYWAFETEREALKYIKAINQ